MSRIVSRPFWIALSLATLPAIGYTQEPEVLTRGPVHEAFATTAEFPTPGPLVPKQPPAPVEELPPDQRPAGDNVQWIPGYWGWDDERNDFIWVSGFWRVPPPGHVWVPGNWQQVPGGFHWTQGFWQPVAEQQQEVTYLPQPPAPVEAGPSIPSPGENFVYIPGTWVWQDRYAWRPGFWLEVRPGWVWVPAHFRWTPVGYVFVEGYWDYPLDGRGLLFPPVVFAGPVFTQPGFVYTPTYAVAYPSLVGSMFVRRGYGSYYFGDYFEPRYLQAGYNPWAGTVRGNSFSLSISFGRGGFYDPLWSYTRTMHRSDPNWVNNISHTYAGRFNGEVPRPPRTFAQQAQAVNSARNPTIVNNITVVTPMAAAPKMNPNLRLQAVQQDDRRREAEMANHLRQVAGQRRTMEANMLNRPGAPAPAPGRPGQPPAARHPEQPVQGRIDVPKQVITRAQTLPAVPEKGGPPPLPKEVNRGQRRPGQPPMATPQPAPSPNPPQRPPMPPQQPPMPPQRPPMPPQQPPMPPVPKPQPAPKQQPTPQPQPAPPAAAIPPQNVPPHVAPLPRRDPGQALPGSRPGQPPAGNPPAPPPVSTPAPPPPPSNPAAPTPPGTRPGQPPAGNPAATPPGGNKAPAPPGGNKAGTPPKGNPPGKPPKDNPPQQAQQRR